MTQKLKPFAGTIAQCPKCLGSGIMHYCNGIPRGVRIFGGGNDCRVEGEHLHRNCALCGYSWLEQCADHAPEASNQ